MSGYPTDRPDGSRPFDARDLELARAAVSIPAVFLILNGILGLVLVGALFGPFVLNPDMPFDFFRQVIAQQPANPQRAQAEKDLEEAEREMNKHREAYVRQNAIALSIRGALDLLAVVGGFYMRSLSGYKISVAAAVVSVIPIATGCCVTGIPFGVWALAVLFRPDVKAAFAARRTAPPPDPDAQYMR